MIKIPSISQTIKGKHWNYVKSHIEPLLEEYRINPEISDQERNLYNELLANNCNDLKIITLGLPSELRNVINENAEGTFRNIPLKSSLDKHLDFLSNKGEFMKKDVCEIESFITRVASNFPQNQNISNAINAFNSGVSLAVSSQELKDNLFRELKKYQNSIPSDNNFKNSLRNRTILYEFTNEDVINFINQLVDIVGEVHEIIRAKKVFIQSYKVSKEIKLELLENLRDELNEIKEERDVDNFNDRLSKIFNYKKFVTGNETWGAYHLVQELNVPVCPYCNRSFISIVKNEEGKTRPELDHFYPKSKYPYLALSIYNLIPSCHICNSNFKGDEDFYNKPHCHPYEDSLHKMAKFKIINQSEPITQILNHRIQPDDLKIELHSNDMPENEQLKNNRSTFQLERLYNYHKDSAIEIANKSLLYSSERLIDLERINKTFEDDYKLFDDIDFGRLIIGNYTNIEDFNKRPLAKFTYDIADQVDLLQNLGIEYKEE